MELKPCPFCKGTDIRFSVKRTGDASFRTYHAAMYCNGCHCYGPRIHTAPMRNDYSSRIEVENDKTLKYYAAEAWNRRANDV
jgi:hypothetical protein